MNETTNHADRRIELNADASESIKSPPLYNENLAPILLNSHPGTKYGIVFPVCARASFQGHTATEWFSFLIFRAIYIARTEFIETGIGAPSPPPFWAASSRGSVR